MENCGHLGFAIVVVDIVLAYGKCTPWLVHNQSAEVTF